jgi:rhamnose utilization protein RhaD (predicted bifunctional aldolase and dehydrogenase)/NAD(P)-dependent dehydrogenase (short-subunit alcohol dehydrogenase family)
LVLHGGGNTSVKTRLATRLGDVVDVLCVKGSGWDLGSIQPAGHPACRMDHLRRMLACATMTDDDMVNELRTSLLDAQAPTPSVEALLHAALPAVYIDHTHADAVLAVADQEDAARICREIWGTALLFVPYVMPGFGLAKACAELYQAAIARGEKPTVMVLERHGIFTWGDTAEQSYTAMIQAVSLAEKYIEQRKKPAAPQQSARAVSRDVELTRRVLPIIRGVLSRMHGLPEEQGLLLDVRADSLELLERDDLKAAINRGCMTPDHVIRTKPLPLVFDARGFDDAASLAAAFQAAVNVYVAVYDNYFDAHAKTRKAPLTKLDPFPRILLVPQVGIVSVAATKKEASVAADVYERTLPVMVQANDVGAYSPVSMSDLFDVEYWSLEQAKIKKVTRPALGGKVALITGAASGIGLGTAELFLSQGAHVVLCDQNVDALAAQLSRLKKTYGAQVMDVVCDVTSEAQVRAAFDAAVFAFGGVDVVVSNAGNAPEGLLHTHAGADKLRASLELNLLSHNTVASVAAEFMVRQGRGGSLLFNASKSAFNQGPGFGPYAVAKTALVSLVRQYAVDLGGAHIRSNAVNADRIRTGLFGGGVLESRAKARGLGIDAYFQSNLLGREVTATDVGQAFLYLATAPSTTGCIITVDGGNAAAFPR